MQVIDHAAQTIEQWRPGVRTRMQAARSVGTSSLCVFEQWCDPGCGAPLHTHDVEEILTVLSGEALITVGTSSSRVHAGQSVVVPPATSHGFTNSGRDELHIQAILAASVFEAVSEHSTGTRRCWER
jgi:mannose-6-phosphate isomerase-like protein (cupin superfamily)